MPPNSAPIKNSNSSTTADNGLSICRKTDGGRIFPTAKPSSSKPDTDKTGKREVMICSHLFECRCRMRPSDRFIHCAKTCA